MLEHAAVHGIEKCFSNFKVVVAAHQVGVDHPSLLPELQSVQLFTRNHFNVLKHPGSRLLVEVDATDGRGVHTQPVLRLEARARCQRDVLEFGEVGFEAVEDGARKARLLLFPLHGEARLP